MKDRQEAVEWFRARIKFVDFDPVLTPEQLDDLANTAALASERVERSIKDASICGRCGQDIPEDARVVWAEITAKWIGAQRVVVCEKCADEIAPAKLSTIHCSHCGSLPPSRVLVQITGDGKGGCKRYDRDMPEQFLDRLEAADKVLDKIAAQGVTKVGALSRENIAALLEDSQEACVSLLDDTTLFVCSGCADILTRTFHPCEACGREVLVAHNRYRERVCSARCQRRVARAKVDHDERECATCGTAFKPSRADAAYCSSACRQKAYRARRAS